MKRAGMLIAALLLASCAFSAERALLDGEHIATPLPEGEYNWRPYPEDEALRVSFQREGDGYVVTPIDRPGERPLRVRMTDVIETHEDDYIAEVELAEGRGVAYAFLWPLGDDRYRFVYEPGAFEASDSPAASEFCTPVMLGGCQFTSIENLRSYYLRLVYPAFSTGEGPERHVDIAPVGVDMPLPAIPTLPRK